MFKSVLSVSACVFLLTTSGLEAAPRSPFDLQGRGVPSDIVLVTKKKLVDGHQAPTKAQAGNTMAPLTEAECTGLGGKNLDAFTSQCASGRICARADQDGVVHKVCITKSAN